MRGIACDCLGLLRAVFGAVVGRELEVPESYSSDWAEGTREEIFLDGARRQLIEIEAPAARAGDLLLFRWRPGLPVKHCAIIVENSEPMRIVHAYDAAQAVKEVNLAAQWRARVVAAFAFPEL